MGRFLGSSSKRTISADLSYGAAPDFCCNTPVLQTAEGVMWKHKSACHLLSVKLALLSVSINDTHGLGDVFVLPLQ
jgi:hypothetical protein